MKDNTFIGVLDDRFKVFIDPYIPMTENSRKDKLLESLYDVCTDRTLTSGQVFDLVIEKTGLVGVSHIRDKAIEIIRPYKQTGKNLEETLNKLYDIVYPSNDYEWSPRRDDD